MRRTLGIDLAAQPENTAACLIEWGAAKAEVRKVITGADCDDDSLVAQMAEADEVGIDAPFGWPKALVEMLPQYLASGRWPVPPTIEAGRIRYDPLRYRETDRAVHDLLLEESGGKVKLWPLSVSSDSIAVVAWRCAHLLHRHAELAGKEVDRTGAISRVFETYPAAALASWSLPHRGYKARSKAKRVASEECRWQIVKGIEKAALPWLDLELSPWARQALVASDHALDAFISALVARAAAQRHTTGPTTAQLALAAGEGWIHVPRPEALEALGP